MAVNKWAAPSLRPGDVSATLLGVKYSSSSLDKSYGSKDHWEDPEAVAEERRLLHGTGSSSLTGTHPCLAEYSFSTYFREASRYWIVQYVSSSRLISIPWSHFLNDRNFLKRIEDMRGNQKPARCWSHFGVVFGELPSS